MKHKKLFIMIGIVVLAVLAIGWWRGSQQQAAAQTPEADIVTAFIGDLSASASASGNVAAQTMATLSLQTSGRVTAVPVQVGDFVEAGAVLVQLDTAVLERAVANAEQNLRIQQANLDNLLVGASDADIASAEAAVTSTVANLADIQDSDSPNASDIAAAEAQLAQAEANLAKLRDGATSEQIAIAEAQVAQAEISLERARLDLNKATLTAPFAGVVTAVYVSEGELASGPAIQIVDSSSLEVVLQVDEVDLANLAVGQTAVVTLEAWPDVEIASEITAIDPKASSNAALVSYPVHLSLETELPVRVGMTANATLITANRDGVLLVPNAAITADRSNGSYFVRLVPPCSDGTEFQEVTVTLGLRDGRYTQIVDGLQAGDQLLISTITITDEEEGGSFFPEPPGDGNGGRPFGQ